MLNREKGSALITVILVVLILTMVGIASLFYMNTEHNLASNDRRAKEALYAAEAGLRAGEAALGGQLNASTRINTMLGWPSFTPTPAVTPPVPVFPASQTGSAYTVACLGTYMREPITNAELANRPVIYTDAAGQISDEAFYSVYLRNNVEDFLGTPTTDVDGKIVLISAGWVNVAGGRIVKIVAEGLIPPHQDSPSDEGDKNTQATNGT